MCVALIALKDPGLGLLAQQLDDLEGLQERVEHL